MDVVFSCTNLKKSYRGVPLFEDLSLTLERGQIYGLAGERGAGKTTLLRLIMGLSLSNGGQMSLLGKTTPTGWRRARSHMGALVEEGIFVQNLSGRKNLIMSCKARGIKNHAKVCAAMLESVGLTHKADTPVRVYTGEEKSLLAIAAALVGSPEFVVLDDPFIGLEAQRSRPVKELLRTLCEEQGTTFLITTRILPALEGLAHRCIFLHQGALLEEISWWDLESRCRGYLCLETEAEGEKAASLIQATYPETQIERTGEELHLRDYHGNPERLQGLLAKQSINVTRLEPVGLTLEHYLSHLIQEKG